MLFTHGEESSAKITSNQHATVVFKMGLDFHLVSRLAQPAEVWAQPAEVWAQLKGSLDVGDPFLSGKVPY